MSALQEFGDALGFYLGVHLILVTPPICEPYLFVVPNVFPSRSHWVLNMFLQVLNVFLNKLPIAPHFIP